jgi:ATP-dependent protease ClpP protease subunit
MTAEEAVTYGIVDRVLVREAGKKESGIGNR